MVTKWWIIFRMILPLVLAASTRLLHIFWPHNQELQLLPVFLPCLVAVFNLYFSSLDRPKLEPREPNKEFQRCLSFWHGLDGLACFILMLFEAITAVGMSENKVGMLGLLFTIPFFFVPYCLIALEARRRLLRCYEILAADILKSPDNTEEI